MTGVFPCRFWILHQKCWNTGLCNLLYTQSGRLVHSMHAHSLFHCSAPTTCNIKQGNCWWKLHILALSPAVFLSLAFEKEISINMCYQSGRSLTWVAFIQYFCKWMIPRNFVSFFDSFHEIRIILEHLIASIEIFPFPRCFKRTFIMLIKFINNWNFD